jgi:hypothetical protein
MAWETKTDRRKILDDVLPEYDAISKAPKSILDFPIAWKMDGAQLDIFEERVRARDAQKFYKAVDGNGNVYLIKNPWSAAEMTPNGVRLPKPELKYRYQEAVDAAKETRASNVVSFKPSALIEERRDW